MWGLTNVGGVTESRGWAAPSELARLALMGVAGVALTAWSHQPAWLLASALSAAMAVWTRRVA